MQVDDQFLVEFQDNVITLSIPEDGVDIDGWKISCRHHPSVSCEIQFQYMSGNDSNTYAKYFCNTDQETEVDNLRRSSGRALGCRFHIQWMDQHQPAHFEYKVVLNGAKPSRNYFTIIYPPLQAAGKQGLSLFLASFDHIKQCYDIARQVFMRIVYK